MCLPCSEAVDPRWHGRVRTTLCRRASIGFSVLAVNVAVTIYETEHAPSKANVVCDGQSRGIYPFQLGLDERLWIHLPETGPVTQYVRQCNPLLPLDTWSLVMDHMGSCHQLLSQVELATPRDVLSSGLHR